MDREAIKQALQELFDEINNLTEKNRDQAQQIEQMECTIMQLKRQLELEHLYLIDTKPRALFAFIKKQPHTELAEKLFTKTRMAELLPARASHKTYAYYLKQICTEVEMMQIKDYWKAMILEEMSEMF